ncbi:MAG: SufD family Fe-S cluster assembly protein [Pseudomonadota bacterium]
MTVAVKLSPFEQSLVEALPASAALRNELTERGLPHRRVEEWKWSDLRVALGRFEPTAGAMSVNASRPADEHVALDRQPFELMPRLAAALGGACAVYDLTDGETLELDLQAEAGAGHGVLAINLPAGVSARVEERYRVADGAFANLAILITVAEGAELTRIVQQDAAPGGVLVATSGLEIEAGAQINQTTLAFGARLARLETHVTHAGHGAHFDLGAAYLLGEGLHLDQTSVVRHTGPHGMLSQLSKGACARGGKGVFQGKIHVERAAQKTDAQMQHRGLLLDERSEIDSKPELKIYADDVLCAHGNALGAIDEDALFYMRQRGLPEPKARALLTESFLSEPLDAIGDDATRERLTGRLRERLAALS